MVEVVIKCEYREPPRTITKTITTITRPIISQILDPLQIFESLGEMFGTPPLDDIGYSMAYPGPSSNDHIWLKPMEGTLPLGDKISTIDVPGYILCGVIPVSYDGEWYECVFDVYWAK